MIGNDVLIVVDIIILLYCMTIVWPGILRIAVLSIYCVFIKLLWIMLATLSIDHARCVTFLSPQGPWSMQVVIVSYRRGFSIGSGSWAERKLSTWFVSQILSSGWRNMRQCIWGRQHFWNSIVWKIVTTLPNFPLFISFKRVFFFCSKTHATMSGQSEAFFDDWCLDLEELATTTDPVSLVNLDWQSLLKRCLACQKF